MMYARARKGNESLPHPASSLNKSTHPLCQTAFTTAFCHVWQSHCFNIFSSAERLQHSNRFAVTAKLLKLLSVWFAHGVTVYHPFKPQTQVTQTPQEPCIKFILSVTQWESNEVYTRDGFGPPSPDSWYIGIKALPGTPLCMKWLHLSVFRHPAKHSPVFCPLRKGTKPIQ